MLELELSPVPAMGNSPCTTWCGVVACRTHRCELVRSELTTTEVARDTEPAPIPIASATSSGEFSVRQDAEA